MTKICIADIKPGFIVEADWYSEKKELLISRGTVISQRHLEVFQRRKISEVYADEPVIEDEELQNLLSVKFEKLADIDFGSDKSPMLPLDLESIKKGERGLDQLNGSSISLELDKLLQQSGSSDKPIGPALKERAAEMTAEERTDKYKSDITIAYQQALKQVESILRALTQGHRIEGLEVNSMVRRFVDIFITDRNILLNISSIKHQGENYLYHHSLNVCLLAINVAASYGYSEKQVVDIGIGALLHDLGMFLVPREIVFKKDRLNQEEWFEVLKHPVLGLHLLEKIRNIPDTAAYMAYQTHERENKTGYPKQRGGNLIHRYAKIVQVADIFESLSSARPYRPEYIPYVSMKRLVKMSSTGLISGEYVKAFLRYASLFPVGSLVELNDGRIAKVVRANGDSYAKPVVSVLRDQNGVMLASKDRYEENLAININTFISRALASTALGDIGLMDGF